VWLNKTEDENKQVMTIIHSYLTFNGNCREAMTFYKKCLGGELNIQTVSDTHAKVDFPEETKDYVLQATLKNRHLILLGTDMVPDENLVKGNTVSLMLICNSEKEMRAFYTKLSKGGKQTSPVAKTHWGALFGSLTDKFGNHWLLNFNKS
jgi:PhnB protein